MVWLVFWSKILFELTFHAFYLNQNEGELNKNIKNKKLKVRNWVASQKALGL